MHKYFSEWYRIASLEPQGDLLAQRWESIENIGQSLDASKAKDLLRLFMAKPLTNSDFLNEYRMAFQKTDPAFPMRENELELRVLAGAAIAWCLENSPDKLGDALALGLLCTDCKGLLPPVPVPEIVALGKTHVCNRSAGLRALSALSGIQAPDVNIKKYLQAVEEACQTGKMPNLGAQLKIIMEKVRDVISTFHRSTADCLNNLVRVMRLQQEETNILWWLFGGCSRDLDDRISDFELPVSCLLAGKELADLVIELPGPFSAVAFLDKMLHSVGGEQTKSVTIQEAVNLSDRAWREKWLKDREIGDIGDLCPVHLAVQKSLEVDGSEEWLPVFEKSVGFRPGEAMPALDLSVQVYQESLFMRAIAEAK
jgi:hypothetical protein